MRSSSISSCIIPLASPPGISKVILNKGLRRGIVSCIIGREAFFRAWRQFLTYGYRPRK